jgi:uncharacterized protein (TIGR02757 family)
MPPAPSSDLGVALERLLRRYDRGWLDSDPLRWPRRFEDPADREVVAILAALLAYGRVASIDRTLERVVGALGARPAATLDETSPRTLRSRLLPIQHRWTRGEDLAWLLGGIRRIRAEHGSVGALVARHARGDEKLRSALAGFRDALHAGDRRLSAARRRARAFLVPDPRGKSACKRLLLLARWCVRGDDGLDLGLWTEGLAPHDLLLPLDVHAHRVASLLGLTVRPRPDWRASEEVTAALRRYAPDDPVRYDFALVRPGILGRCRYRHVPDVCAACDLRAVCREGTPNPTARPSLRP